MTVSTWLHELAGDIVYRYGHSTTQTAQELVDYALGEEMQARWGIDLPSSFTDEDRAELVRLVDSIL